MFTPEDFKGWWLARDSGSNCVECYPAILTGMTKHSGYVCYEAYDLLIRCHLVFHYKDCKKHFGACPKEGELLYVKWNGRRWVSEKIELEFS